MKKTLLVASPFLAALALLLPVQGQAPVKPAEVAPVEDLVKEAEAQADRIAKYLADDDEFEAERTRIAQAGGLLACLGQLLAEHSDRGKVEVHGPTLRDAGRAVARAGSRDAALESLQAVRQALAGKKAEGAVAEHPWDQLVDMYPLMEEVELRSGALRRAVRRSRDPLGDSLHATSLAVLALAIHADTSLLGGDADDIARWQKYSVDMQQGFSALATAFKEKDSEAISEGWRKGMESCNDCHRAFRDE